MNSLQYILLFVLIGGGFVYFSSCLFALSGHFKQKKTDDGLIPTVSIIVPTRNEEKNIGLLLDDLLGQTYPSEKIEIIVVDDCSSDKTSKVVRKYMDSDRRISLRNTIDSLSSFSHKKKAVHEGILASKGEIIMTTDADCRLTSGWVRGMIRYLTDSVDLVAGTVSVQGGGFLGMLEAIEFFGIQTMAAGLMNAGFPVTCNGANLAYRRSAFERVGGYDGVGDMVSGDDDLLMQKIAGENRSQVVFVTDSKASVRTKTSGKPGEFINKRARWASKIGRYPSLTARIFLSSIFTFFVAIPVWLILTLTLSIDSKPVFWALGLKISGDALLTGYGALKSGRPELILLLPVAEILHIPYIIGVTLKGFFGSFEWRGRQTRAISLEYGKKSQ
ncbi:MAG: glycosyltransferase [Candidatus Latescibacteria bacterium]|nr:glycosyltransferase [Candidatus Latescibacterota bacterium]